MNKKRIAVVSTDGITVNEHFGKAKCFLIFDVNDQMILVEKRKTQTLSTGNLNHPFDPEKFSRIANLLKDCSKVYVSRIGDTPAAKLMDLGIEPVVFSGNISDI